MDMRETDFTDQSRHKKYVILLIIIIVSSVVCSYAVFLYKPQIFYFRSWEYVNEIGFNEKTPHSWDGLEKGDASRPYFLNYQDSWYTHVSWDEDGWRSVPFPSEEYKVIVLGDSQTWGSGLSDNETFPWLLAEDLNIPVFNGGRGAGSANVFNKPSNKHVNVVVQVSDLGQLNVKKYFFTNWSWDAPYIPLMKTEAISPPIQRYYIPGIGISRISALASDLLFPPPFNNYLLGTNGKIQYNESDMNNQVRMISSYNKYLKEKGYVLVFVLIPSRIVMYSNSTDEYSLHYPQNLSEKLRAEGIHVVDLSSSFYQNKTEGLYQKTDSHWTANGTKIAAEVVAGYISENRLLDVACHN